MKEAEFCHALFVVQAKKTDSLLHTSKANDSRSNGPAPRETHINTYGSFPNEVSSRSGKFKMEIANCKSEISIRFYRFFLDMR